MEIANPYVNEFPDFGPVVDVPKLLLEIPSDLNSSAQSCSSDKEFIARANTLTDRELQVNDKT
jgi:hypothetical protein